MNTVAWDKISERFQIRVTDGETLGAVIYTFPVGITNEQACAAFDRYRETDELPEEPE